MHTHTHTAAAAAAAAAAGAAAAAAPRAAAAAAAATITSPGTRNIDKMGTRNSNIKTKTTHTQEWQGKQQQHSL